MAIKRYHATKDNTLTNAYKANLTTRGTSGNMGQSDILETFHIYGQATSASAENARIIVQFDIDSVATDRTAKVIPDSGSVSWFLKLYNADHPQTTPKDFTLEINPISQSWDEGLGLDMEEYSDIQASNWVFANNTPVAQSATFSFNSADKNDYGGKFVSLWDVSGSRYNFWFDDGTDDAAPDITGEEIQVDISGDANAAAIADTFKGVVDGRSEFDAIIVSTKVGVENIGKGSVQVPTGNADDVEISIAVTGSDYSLWKDFWGNTVEGASIKTGSDANTDMYVYKQTFDTGYEDLEVDVSNLVEDWIAGTYITNNGFRVAFTGSLETTTDSYYTKKFFARGSQFYHKRPVLEARWDSSKKDNRGNFYLSSTMVPAADNLMKLYLYNIVKGNLTDIPYVGTGELDVSVFSGNIDNTAPSDLRIGFAAGGGTVAAGQMNTTASWVETGIYSCSFAYTASEITTIFDVWHTASGPAPNAFPYTEFHTGSGITVNTHDSVNYNFDQKYVSRIINLRPTYSREESSRFRVYVREKDWSPTIYSKASKKIETSLIEDAYYKIARVSDNFEVIPYGTSSLNYTRLSYDVSGSYFDLQMDLFDKDQAYEIKLAYVVNGEHVEQPEKFRFRVE